MRPASGILACFVVAACADHSDPHPIQRASPAPAPAKLDAATVRAEIEKLRGSFALPDRGAASRPRADAEPTEAWRALPRKAIGFASFGFQRPLGFATRKLLRSRDLNPRDVALTSKQRTSLRRLVVRYHEQIGKVRRILEECVLHDFEALISSGQLAPLAKKEQRAATSEQLEREWAERKRARATDAEIRDAFGAGERQGAVVVDLNDYAGVRVHGPNQFRQGELYAIRYSEMPTASLAAPYADQLGLEFVVEVVAWFAAQGLLHAEQAQELCEFAQSHFEVVTRR